MTTYVMGLQPLEIFQFFQSEGRPYAPESDVYRRQILTYNDGPCADRVNISVSCYPQSLNRGVLRSHP